MASETVVPILRLPWRGAGRRTVKQLPNGAISYFGYDAASRQTSILNVESDMTPISATYYEWNEDGLPTRQRRRGDYDVDHEYWAGLGPRRSFLATPECSSSVASLSTAPA